MYVFATDAATGHGCAAFVEFASARDGRLALQRALGPRPAARTNGLPAHAGDDAARRLARVRSWFGASRRPEAAAESAGEGGTVMADQDLVKTGITGLDAILSGGIPRGNIILLEGAIGTGKTTLGVEFVYRGASEFDEPGIIVLFEVSPDKLVRDAARLGWDLPALEARAQAEDHLHDPPGVPAGAAAGRQPAPRRSGEDGRPAHLRRRRGRRDRCRSASGGARRARPFTSWSRACSARTSPRCSRSRRPRSATDSRSRCPRNRLPTRSSGCGWKT